MASTGPGEAIELGVTYISVVGETDKLAKSVRNAIRDAQTYATANPLKLKADVDVSHIGSVQIPVTADTTRFTTQVHDAIRDAQTYATANPIKIRADVDVSHIGAVTIPVNPNMAHFASQVWDALRDMEHSGLFRFGIPIDLDSAAALAQFAALRAAMQAMATPITQDVDVDVNRGALSKLSSMASLGGLTSATAGLSAASAGIAAIGGAAGAALGAVGALGVGIASLGPIAAAAGATAAVGLSGVADAFKALSSASDSAASDGASQAKAVAAAQKQVESAVKGVTTAEKNLTTAKKDAEDAEKDLTRARKDAEEQLEDYKLSLADAALSEKEAALALKEAQRDVADAKTAEDREKALLRVERAQLSLTEAQERNRDLNEEAAEAEAKGIENADGVVAAKEKLAGANDAVTDAEQALADAHKQVAEAQAALAEATTQGSSAQQKAAAALAKLSPNAQAFVLAMRDLGPAWTEVRKSVQDNLFAGLDQSITRLAQDVLPTLKTGMGEVATSLNGLTLSFADFWRAPANLGALESIFQGTARFIDGMGPGLAQATTGFLSLGQAFAPVAQQVGAQLGGMLGQIGQAFTDAFQSGALTELIGNFGNILAGLGAGLNPFIDALIQIGNIVGPTLGPLFQTLGESIAALAPSLGAIGATFAETLTALLPDLTKFIDALLVGLEPVLPVIGELLRALGNALTPLIGPMSQIAQVVGTALAQAINALAPAMGPLGTAFASLVTTLSPIIPVIAEIVSGLIQALAPALTTIFDAMGPIIKQVADLMMPVFRQLQPILADVAQQIGTALAKAMEQLAPHLPALAQSFGDLVLALAPFIPQLVEVALQLLPPMVDVLISLLPYIEKLIDLFTWIAKNVMPIVVDSFQDWVDETKKGLQFVSDALNTVGEIKDWVVDKIGGLIDYLSGLPQKFKTAGSGLWDFLTDGYKAAINWLIGKWNTFSLGFDFTIPVIDKHVSFTIDTPDLPLLAGGGVAGVDGRGRIYGPGSGTSDSVLALDVNSGLPTAFVSAGEGVVTAAAMANGGAELVAALNAGWVPPLDMLRAMLPGLAGGGTIRVNEGDITDVQRGMWNALASAFPDAILTSATRYADVGSGFDHHMAGKAIDVAGPNMPAMAEWIAKNYPGSLELIHSNGFGHNIKNGEDVGNGYSFYGADTMAGHADHVHWAMSSAPSIPAIEPDSGAGAFNSGGGSGGGNSGGGGGGGTTSGGTATAGTTPDPGGTTYRVWVSNWPSTLGGTGYGTGATTTTGTGTPAATNPTDTTTGATTGTTTTGTTTTATQQTHPLQGAPLTGELFTGDAPWWYGQTSVEGALTTLQSQAQTQWESTVSDVQGFFTEDNLKEMLETGASLLGIGATGSAGGGDTYNFNGMDPKGSALAVERVQRRRTLAQQRGMGGISL